MQEIFLYQPGRKFAELIRSTCVYIPGPVARSGKVLAVEEPRQWTVDMATPKDGLLWWDRESDEQGNPIRADVREAAHEIWQLCCARTSATLGDTADAPAMMEASVSYISRHLDRAGNPPPPGKAKQLLGLHFSQLLRKESAWLRRIECVGDNADLDKLAPILDWDWAARVNLRLDWEKLCPFLSLQTFTMFSMRRLGHPWEEIGKKIGIATGKARLSFWHSVRSARNLLERKGRSQGNGVGR